MRETNYLKYFEMPPIELKNGHTHYLKRLTPRKSNHALYEIINKDEDKKFGVVIVRLDKAEIMFFDEGKMITNFENEVSIHIKDFFGVKTVNLLS